MTVRELKDITASSVTLTLMFAKSKQDAMNEISIGSPVYTFVSEESRYDEKEVFYAYASRKEELEVWVKDTAGEMERTKIIVWLDDDKEWSRVYLGEDGKLYVKIGAGKSDFALLNNCFVREISSL